MTTYVFVFEWITMRTRVQPDASYAAWLSSSDGLVAWETWLRHPANKPC